MGMSIKLKIILVSMTLVVAFTFIPAFVINKASGKASLPPVLLLILICNLAPEAVTPKPRKLNKSLRNILLEDLLNMLVAVDKD